MYRDDRAALLERVRVLSAELQGRSPAARKRSWLGLSRRFWLKLLVVMPLLVATPWLAALTSRAREANATAAQRAAETKQAEREATLWQVAHGRCSVNLISARLALGQARQAIARERGTPTPPWLLASRPFSPGR